MNTPRQANVRPSVGSIAGDNRSTYPGTRPSTSFVLPVDMSPSPVPAGVEPKGPSAVHGDPDGPAE